MYIKNSNLSRYKIKKILKCFSIDLTATQTSKLLWISRKTINRFYSLFRNIIFEYQTKLFRELKINWKVEADECYFWAKRVRWFKGKLKRGRWTKKQPVFWIMKRNWEIYTEIIPNCTANTLEWIILNKVDKWSEMYTDSWKWYDWLVDVWYDKHYRVKHWENEFSKWWWVHINWIENFWSYTKRRLNKFNWVKVNFELHLKECEFRYWKSEVEIEKKLINLMKYYFK